MNTAKICKHINTTDTIITVFINSTQTPHAMPSHSFIMRFSSVIFFLKCLQIWFGGAGERNSWGPPWTTAITTEFIRIWPPITTPVSRTEELTFEKYRHVLQRKRLLVSDGFTMTQAAQAYFSQDAEFLRSYPGMVWPSHWQNTLHRSLWGSWCHR